MNIKSFIKKNKVIIAIVLVLLFTCCGGCCYSFNKKTVTINGNTYTKDLPSSSGNSPDRPLGGEAIAPHIITPPIQSEINLGSWFGRGAVNQETNLDEIGSL